MEIKIMNLNKEHTINFMTMVCDIEYRTHNTEATLQKAGFVSVKSSESNKALFMIPVNTSETAYFILEIDTDDKAISNIGVIDSMGNPAPTNGVYNRMIHRELAKLVSKKIIIGLKPF